MNQDYSSSLFSALKAAMFPDSFISGSILLHEIPVLEHMSPNLISIFPKGDMTLSYSPLKSTSQVKRDATERTLLTGCFSPFLVRTLG